MAIMSTIRQRNAALLLIAAFVLSSCAGAQRADYATQFAKEGVKFTRTLPQLYDEYYRLAIDADSATLASTRDEPGITSKELSARLKQADEDLERTSAIVRGLKEHADLLREYFQAIRRLTHEDVGSGVGESTQTLVNGIMMVRGDLGAAIPFGVPVNQIAKPVGNFVVVSLKNRALKRELDEHGETIDRELAVQEAILQKIVRNMASHAEAWTTVAYVNPVYEQFRDANKPLRRSWYAYRRKYLTSEQVIESAQEAEAAMKELRKAWRELAQGGPDASTMAQLIRRVQATVALVNALKA
jgi:chaperonin cofactor prefoldin